ncbi:hypothetical protein M885DRAFT_503447 [Pelagophyceae sp. CCMP2097]|nr:hypothetical protein M885DRAFT_503447 [Pelagophyceae sp. CCMP2097]
MAQADRSFNRAAIFRVQRAKSPKGQQSKRPSQRYSRRCKRSVLWAVLADGAVVHEASGRRFLGAASWAPLPLKRRCLWAPLPTAFSTGPCFTGALPTEHAAFEVARLHGPQATLRRCRGAGHGGRIEQPHRRRSSGTRCASAARRQYSFDATRTAE